MRHIERRPGRRIIALVCGLALCAATSHHLTAHGEETGQELELRRGLVRLAKRGGERVAKRVVLKGDLLPEGLASEIDLEVDAVRITLNGSVVFDLTADGSRRGLERRRFGRWVFREQGKPKRKATRLRLDLGLGRFRLDARGLALDAELLGAPEDAEVAIDVGGRRLATSVDFRSRKKQWRFRAKRRAVGGPVGSPGGGDPGGTDPGGGDPGTGPGGTTPADGPQSFSVIASGTQSGVRTRREVVIRDAAAWQTLWTEHQGGTAPAIDFTRDMVVGVFQGDQPTAGYGESMVGILSTGGNYDVRHTFSSTQGSCFVAPVITQPFVLARVQRTSGTVGFTESRAVSICHGGP